MNGSKIKYLYYTILAMLVIAVLYSAYSLVVYGSPTVKSRKLYLREGNELHNDSLYDEAIEPYLRALEFDTNNSNANFNSATNLLMKIYSDQGGDTTLIANAQAMLNRSFESDTLSMNKSQAMHNSGLLYHITEELEKAAEAYKEALRQNPADEETRYNLAVVLYQLDNQQEQQDQNQQQQEQQQEQNQEQQEEQQQQQQQQEQQQQQQQDEQEEENNDEQQSAGGGSAQMSDEEAEREEAERILNAVMLDEKEVMERMENENQSGKRRLQNNW